jgi:hypothetical protein
MPLFKETAKTENIPPFSGFRLKCFYGKRRNADRNRKPAVFTLD